MEKGKKSFHVKKRSKFDLHMDFDTYWMIARIIIKTSISFPKISFPKIFWKVFLKIRVINNRHIKICSLEQLGVITIIKLIKLMWKIYQIKLKIEFQLNQSKMIIIVLDVLFLSSFTKKFFDSIFKERLNFDFLILIEGMIENDEFFINLIQMKFFALLEVQNPKRFNFFRKLTIT